MFDVALLHADAQGRWRCLCCRQWLRWRAGTRASQVGQMTSDSSGRKRKAAVDSITYAWLHIAALSEEDSIGRTHRQSHAFFCVGIIFACSHLHACPRVWPIGRLDQQIWIRQRHAIITVSLSSWFANYCKERKRRKSTFACKGNRTPNLMLNELTP